MEQRITVDSILDKKFSTVAKGFNQQEVDEYLDQICDEFDRRDAEMNTLRQEIAQLKAAQANGSNTVPQQRRRTTASARFSKWRSASRIRRLRMRRRRHPRFWRTQRTRPVSS